MDFDLSKANVEQFYETTAFIPTSVIVFRDACPDLRDVVVQCYLDAWPEAVYQRVRTGYCYQWMVELPSPLQYISENIDYPTAWANGIMDQMLDIDKSIVVTNTTKCKLLKQLDDLRRCCYQWYALFSVFLQQQLLTTPADLAILQQYSKAIAKIYDQVEWTQWSDLRSLVKYLDSRTDLQ
jgi:hypothetical protein